MITNVEYKALMSKLNSYLTNKKKEINEFIKNGLDGKLEEFYANFAPKYRKSGGGVCNHLFKIFGLYLVQSTELDNELTELSKNVEGLNKKELISGYESLGIKITAVKKSKPAPAPAPVPAPVSVIASIDDKLDLAETNIISLKNDLEGILNDDIINNGPLGQALSSIELIKQNIKNMSDQKVIGYIDTINEKIVKPIQAIVSDYKSRSDRINQVVVPLIEAFKKFNKK